MTEEVQINIEERTDDWLADRRKELQQENSSHKRAMEAISAEIDDIEQEFHRRFAERNSTGTQTSRWVITQRTDDNYPEVFDRESFDDYLLRSKRIHLLQKRLGLTAVREEIDLLMQEKTHWLEELEENNWDKNTCIRCLEHITQRQIDELTYNEEEKGVLRIQLQQKLEVLKAVGTWKQSTQMALDEFYQIPGITMREKITLSQKKR